MMPGISAGTPGQDSPERRLTRRDLSELHAIGNWAVRPTQGGLNRNETVPATLSLRKRTREISK
jgi:hypothetical protein